MSKLSFLDGDTPDEPEVVSPASPEASQGEPQAEPAEAPLGAKEAPAPERGPDGKFAPASPKMASQGLPSEAPSGAKAGHVPISAMLDEREKRQAAERQLADLKARAEPPPPLEPTEQLQAALYAQNLRASRRFAEREYGKDTIATVHDWAAAKCLLKDYQFRPGVAIEELLGVKKTNFNGVQNGIVTVHVGAAADS